MHSSILSLVKRDRIILPDQSKQKRSFLDFSIDGMSLYEIVTERLDLISTLWVDPLIPTESEKAVGRMLKTEAADLPNDRVSLYICAECGEQGCGVFSVHITFQKDLVIWSDFGTENDYEEEVSLAPYSSLGPFHFNRKAYETLFHEVLLTLR